MTTTAFTHCCFCSVQCAVTCKQSQSTALQPVADFPLAYGKACAKGLHAGHALRHAERLREPLIRIDGVLTPTTWANALAYVAHRIQSLQSEFGADAMSVYGSGSLTNESAYLLGKFARVALRTRYIDYNGRYCMSSAATAMNRVLGMDRGLTFPLEDLHDADFVLLLGSNLAECQPVLIPYLQRIKQRGGHVVVVDPRSTATARLATTAVKIAPGTDGWLLNALLHVLIRDEKVDRPWIAERSVGFAAVEEHVRAYSPVVAGAVTGIAPEVIEHIAALYHSAKRAYVLTGRGIEQQEHGVDQVIASLNLALAAGKIGRPGCGFGAITGQANGQGGREHGQKADQLPGYRSIVDAGDRVHVADVWGIDAADLPDAGVSAYDMFSRMEEGIIRGMLVMGSNPVVSSPDKDRVKRIVNGLDFLCVVDLFLTETAEHADVVLPASGWLEAGGTTTNLEGRVLLRSALHPTFADTRPDWAILCDLAHALGKPNGFRFAREEAIFDELCRASAGGRADYAGMTYDRIRREQGMYWPCPTSDSPGTPRVFLEQFGHADGKAHFSPVAFTHPTQELIGSVGLPLTLLTGRVTQHYLTGTQTRRIDALNRYCPRPLADIHPVTAAALRLEAGESIVLSRGGVSVSYPVQITRHAAPGTVFVAFHWDGEDSVNRLVQPALDPASRMPAFKKTVVMATRTALDLEESEPYEEQTQGHR